MVENSNAPGNSAASVQEKRQIRPLRDALFAMVCGLFLGFVFYYNPQTEGPMRLIGMTVNGLFWALLFFVVVLSVQLIRRGFRLRYSGQDQAEQLSRLPMPVQPIGAKLMKPGEPTQKRIMIGAAVAIALSILFPPFFFRGGGGITINLGFGFLFSPPSYDGRYAGSVDLPLLLLEWAAIAIVSGILWLISREK